MQKIALFGFGFVFELKSGSDGVHAVARWLNSYK